MTTRPPESPSQGPFILPPPKTHLDLGPVTDEMRARGIARIDAMLAHLDDPPEPGEIDWDVDALFPADRVR